MKKPYLTSFKFFREEMTKVRAEIHKESLDNPFDSSKKVVQKFNPVYFKAYVREVSPEVLTWYLYGIKEKGAKELVTEKKNLSILKECNRIYINGEEYTVYKDAKGRRAQFFEKGNELVVILERM